MLLRLPLLHLRLLPPPKSSATSTSTPSLSLTDGNNLTSRERRQLRQERRQSSNWREEVEEKLLIKPKKRYQSWMEELNLDNLALPGPQWWVVRVSRVNGHEIADRLVRAFLRVYPEFPFKVYIPAVKVKRKLKNGTLSVKPNPLFPGCVFLHCVLNKEIHDFVRECPGVGGFVGSKVGNTKRQINRPKPVDPGEMDAIFKKAKEEQEKHDREFEKEHQLSETSEDSLESIIDNVKSKPGTKAKRARKGLGPSGSTLLKGADGKLLVTGSNVQVLSGPFAEYTGCLKEINGKTSKATIAFMLFGKESFVDVEIDQIMTVESS